MDSICIHYWECCCKEDLSLFVHLVVYSFTYISVWTHVYLFYTLGYNPIECYLCFCLNCSNFSHWELFQVGSCLSLTHPHLIFFFRFWSTSLFTHTTRYSGHPCIFPAPVLETVISSRKPSSFYWKIAFRNQDLTAGCVHCSCGLVAPRPCLQTEMGIHVCTLTV